MRIHPDPADHSPPQPPWRTTPDGTILIATDGSALGNPGPAGWCWWSGTDCWAADGAATATNNAMELLAIAEALEATAPHPVQIETDSSYARDAVTRWIHGWRRRNWKTAAGTPVKNRDLIVRIDTAMTDRDVTIRWVKGHSTHAGNVAADTRARAAATATKRQRPVDRGPGWTAPDPPVHQTAT